MDRVNRKFSLYQEAKASFVSLGKQIGLLAIGLLVILFLTKGNPSSLVLAISFGSGIIFVAWNENNRIHSSRKLEKPSKLSI